MSMMNLLGGGSTSQNGSGGKTPVNLVRVTNDVLDVKARQMTMNRTMGKHDDVTLALSSPTMENTEGLNDQPISFVYGLSPRTEFFHGYVVQVTEEQRDSTNLNFTLALLGTTMRMYTSKPRFWSNKSIPSVIRDLVNANGLGYAGSDHAHLWKALVQTDESDWAVANSLTSRIGYTLVSWNGLVYCDDPLAMYNSSGPYVRLVSESNLASDERSLLEFTPAQDSEKTYTGIGVRFAYLTSDGKVGWVQQANYKKHRFTSGLPIRSQQEAEVYMKALDRLTGDWRQRAAARIKGDPSIYPGINVEVVTSTAIKDKKYDGKWLVASVQHKMDNQSYQTMLVLVRPDVSIPSQVLPFRHFWESDSRGKPSLFIKSDGDEVRWVSTWSNSTLASIL